MSDLRDLYQQLIIDHGRNPRNFKKLASANYIKEGFNPLCGDRLTLYLFVKNNIIIETSFDGAGCAISMASASLMTEALRDKNLLEAELLFNAFHLLITKGDNKADENLLGKLSVLSGVHEFPARVKCATLAWQTMIAAIHNDPNIISTE